MTSLAEGNSHILPYALDSHAPAFTLPDTLTFQQERGAVAVSHLQGKFDQLKSEYDRLIGLANDTALVYNATYNFVPRVGHTYYLYNPDRPFLSLIPPQEWPSRTDFQGAFRFTTDNTWQRLTPNEF